MSHQNSSVSALYRSARSIGSLHAGLDAVETTSSQKAPASVMAGANNALNAAFYGTRPGQQGGYFGHPHTAVYHAYESTPTDKVALAEGVLQVTAPDTAPLAVQTGWQADLLNELSGTTGGSSMTRVQLMQPIQPCAVVNKPSAGYTMYRQEHGLPQVSSTAMLQIQQALQAQQAQQAQAQAQARAISQRVSGSQLAFVTAQQGNREVNMHTNPAQDASSSALYSRHAAYLHSSGVSRDQNSKQQGSQSAQLVAHLANVAAGKAQYPVGADAMQLSPEYRPYAAGNGHAVIGSAAVEATPIACTSSGGSSIAATACSADTNTFLDCEDPADEVVLSPVPVKLSEPGVRHIPDGMQYVYVPHSYTDRSTLIDLDLANRIMSKIELPGDIQFMPVDPDTMLYKLGTRYGFTAFSIALGSSYFQRLVANMPHLEYAVRQSGPAYAHYLDSVPARSNEHLQMLHAQYSGNYVRDGTARHTEESTLWSIQFTCVYLATKVVDRMPMLEMLRYILTHLYRSPVSKAQAYEVESKCLQGLSFRLGPYFKQQQLYDPHWPY